jgi:putative FmdB family regulatory protein
VPFYEYRCDTCHHHFEAQQGMTEPVLTECPACKGSVKRLISRNVLINFKGSGFYVTDSNAGSSASATKAPETSTPEKAAGPKPDKKEV